jgi:tetratricopeptide (TPR) repeat protein
VWDFAATADRVLQLRRVVRREAVRLAVLSAVAGAVFLGTRVLAQRAERLELQDAARWHERGQELMATSPADAAVAFRRAVVKHRGEKRYVLALAEALARAGNTASAVRALEGLREFSPEDAEVNLALARLYRDQAEHPRAVRYYYHAIYAPDATPDSARRIRLELVRMLLDAGDLVRAQSELLAATIDAPASRDLRIELARLFERAGNDARAAEQYARVLADAPDDLTALDGAVRTAFATGDYRGVLSHKLPDAAAAEARELSLIASEILSRDPLASRLSSAERRRRVLRNISYLEERWVACTPEPRPSTPGYPPALVRLRAAARPAAMGRDSEALEAAVESLDRLRQQIEQRCNSRTAVDRALGIIARAHGVGGS